MKFLLLFILIRLKTAFILHYNEKGLEEHNQFSLNLEDSQGWINCTSDNISIVNNENSSIFEIICFRNTTDDDECNYTLDDLLEMVNKSFSFQTVNNINVTCNLEHFPAHLQKFSRITHLNLSHNSFTHLRSNPFKYSRGIKYLWLVNNRIEGIDRKFLWSLRELHTIELSYNKLKYLPNGLLANNLNLRIFKVDYNLLSEIPRDLFFSQKRLHIVYLNNNKIKTLPDKLFSKNPELDTLDASHNMIKSIAYSVFPRNINIMTLKLNDNVLKTLNLSFINDPPEKTLSDLVNTSNLSKHFFRRFAISHSLNWDSEEDKRKLSSVRVKSNNLRSLHIDNNALEELPENLFNHSKLMKVFSCDSNKLVTSLEGFNIFYSLISFQMMNCGITEIDRNYFTRFGEEWLEIQEVKLSNNRLKSLHHTTFWGFIELRILWLDHNRLTSLPDGFFKQLTKLRELDLSFNDFSTLSLEAFGLKNLRNFNLESNHIAEFKYSSFKELQRRKTLHELNLSNNCLTTESVQHMINTVKPDLKFVDLSRNAIREIPQLNSDYTYYNLSFNSIRMIDMKNISRRYKYGEVKQIFLCPNPIKYICTNKCKEISNETAKEIANYHSQLSVNICTDVTQMEEENYFGSLINPFYCLKCPTDFYKSLLCVNISDCDISYIYSFRSIVTENCPMDCECYQIAINQRIVVNCSDSDLQFPPSFFPKNTSILYFENNFLEDLGWLNSSVWPNLIEIYLDDNLIKSLENWDIGNKTKKISLRNNNIKTLTEDIMYAFAEIEVNLGGNPWKCDCSSLSFKTFLKSPNKVLDVNNVTCESTGERIIDVSDDFLCPQIISPVYLPLLLSIAIILPLSIGMLLIIYYRNKQLVIAYIYTHFPKLFRIIFQSNDIEENKQYDAFVSYSMTDRDVVLCLVRELEEKEPKYSLCIHERDWIPGNPICLNIANSVLCSQRTIIILSNEFLKSIWFPVELHSAYYQMLEDKVNHLIIVVRGKLPPVHTLDRDLQVLLKTKTYLIWGERWFWEKLRLALPHNRTRFKPLNEDNLNTVAGKIEKEILRTV